METAVNATPEWFEKGTVYQINPRTFSPEGTLKAITKELPVLANLGFGIIYLCPVFMEDDDTDPPGWSARQIASRTGNPKNPYRMNDYFQIDPEYGTMDDLRELVRNAHRLGLRVLLDLVYYHIGPKAPILQLHPEFTKKDADGNVLTGKWHFPLLDHQCPGLREYLYCNMTYYVGVIDVDGFRCDVGDMIPLDFWAEGLRRIREIKPDAVLINEGKKAEYMTVFQSNYGFYWLKTLHKILTKELPASELRSEWEIHRAGQPEGSKYLRAMDTHDTVTDWPCRTEVLAGHAGMELIQVLNYLIDGIPMVYCGNELADSSKLSMFSNRFYPGKFTATDRQSAASDFSLRRQNVIKRLNELKKTSETLAFGKTCWIENSAPDSVISFFREYRGERIALICNLSDSPVVCRINVPSEREILLQSECAVTENGDLISFPPYGYIAAKI